MTMESSANMVSLAADQRLYDSGRLILGSLFPPTLQYAEQKYA